MRFELCEFLRRCLMFPEEIHPVGGTHECALVFAVVLFVSPESFIDPCVLASRAGHEERTSGLVEPLEDLSNAAQAGARLEERCTDFALAA